MAFRVELTDRAQADIATITIGSYRNRLAPRESGGSSRCAKPSRRWQRCHNGARYRLRAQTPRSKSGNYCSDESRMFIESSSASNVMWCTFCTSGTDVDAHSDRLQTIRDRAVFRKPSAGCVPCVGREGGLPVAAFVADDLGTAGATGDCRIRFAFARRTVSACFRRWKASGDLGLVPLY